MMDFILKPIFTRNFKTNFHSSEYQKNIYLFIFAFSRKIHYDDDDYVALNVADELEEEETLSGPEKVNEPQGRYHRPRRKRKRKRRKVDSVGPEEELVDPEELPPRARWTIVATACLLLAMSLLLVGVTLRMAPIIDDMGKLVAINTFVFNQTTYSNCFVWWRLKKKYFAYFLISLNIPFTSDVAIFQLNLWKDSWKSIPRAP